MAETPLRWARIDDGLMANARLAAGLAADPAAEEQPPDDSTLIRAGLYLASEATHMQLREAIKRARKVAGWPSGTAAAS